MQPEQMSLALRERVGLEGADLGIQLLRENLWLTYRAWLAVSAPLLLACLAVGIVNGYVAALLMWWLAPMGERVVVMVLSRRAFRQAVSWRQAVRETFKSGMKGIVLQLTILRFSPYRGFLNPVWTLERPGFQAYRKRAETLTKDFPGPIGATVACWHAEFFVQISSILLVAMLMPQHAIRWEVWFEKITGGADFAQQIFNLLFVLTVLGLRPFYAASGFGLYLSRRTQLEGWDVELAFRGVARRLAKAAMGTALAGLLLFGGLCGSEARAQADPFEIGGEAVDPFEDEELVAGPTPEQALRSPNETVEDLLAQPPFRVEKEKKTYFDFSWMEREGKPRPMPSFLAPAIVLRVLAIVALGVLIYFVVRLCMRVMVPPEWREEDYVRDLGVTMVDEIVREGMPSDPGGRAAALAAEGRLREALSLLIRGAIGHFRERAAVPIPSGATESECLRRIRGRVPMRSYEHFRDVARLWQTLAYAARPVSADAVVALARSFDAAYPATTPVAEEKTP